MKYLYKHVSLIFLISTLLLSCKKSSTTPELVTFMKLDTKEIRYGLDRHYPEEKDEDLLSLLKKPFQKLDV